MLARDRDEVRIAYQMPLYPMIDNLDTESSAHNHGKVWNTRKNHMAWKMYLRKNAGVEAEIDIYKSNMHAFDMMKPKLEISRRAAEKFNQHFEYAVEHYFAINE